MPTHVAFVPRSGQHPGARYESGLTVYDEALVDGYWIGRYWSAIGRVQPEQAPLPETVPPRELNPPSLADRAAFRLSIGGEDLTGGWEWVGAAEVTEPAGQTGRRTGKHDVVELKHRSRAVRVRVHTQLDGSPFIIRWLEVSNEVTASIALSGVSCWSGLVWRVPNYTELVPEKEGSAFTLGYYASTMWAYEGDFAWEALPNGERRIEGWLGHSGWGRPIVIAGNEAHGELFTAELAWSGNWTIGVRAQQDLRFHADRRYGGLPEARLALSIGPSCADAVLRVIAPGETVETPAVHLGRFHGDLDACVAALHTHARDSVLAPQVENRAQPFIYNAGVYPYDWRNEADLIRHVDIAVRYGVEQFIIDAGWYGREPGVWHDNVGDWREGPWLPHGLAPVRAYAREKGLPFGLWIEVESIGPNSDLLKNHPDWVMTRDQKPAGIHEKVIGRALDLAKPEVAAWVEAELGRLIETHDLDLLRLDYNSMPLAGGNRVVDGIVENTLWRHCEAIYGIADRLRARFPNVIFENCSEGGGRTDLGIMARFQTTWISDWMNLPRSAQILNGVTMTLPPEVCNRLFALVGGDAALPGSLDSQLRLPLFGHPCYCQLEPIWTTPNPHASARISHCIDMYKRFIRPMLATCRVYHHTPVLPNLEPNGWCVLEYASADASRGLLGLFRLNAVGSNEYVCRPRGLDRARRYRVTFDNDGQVVEYEGSELARHGIATRLERALTSELLLFEAI